MTLDVSSLYIYTNSPHDDCIESCSYFLDQDYSNYSKYVEAISNLIKLVLSKNNFQCNDVYYLQTLGTAMGTKMAPSFASLFMGKFEKDFLNNCMKNYGGFDHNIQTLRIITTLENRYYDFNGLNLSFETLDGLIKHNGPVKDLTKFNKILGKNFFKNKINFLSNSSLEAQIASISDDIAYNSHDLEDGLKANLFKLNDLKNIPILNKIITKHIKRIKKNSIDLVIRQIIREIINEMVSDVIISTKKNIKTNKIRSLNNVYKAHKLLVCFSDQMKNFDISIKKFLKQKMYFHSKVNFKTNYGQMIINKLFTKIRSNPKKYINIKKYGNYNIERMICDYIAGMTDRYAINLYNQIK